MSKICSILWSNLKDFLLLNELSIELIVNDDDDEDEIVKYVLEFVDQKTLRDAISCFESLQSNNNNNDEQNEKENEKEKEKEKEDSMILKKSTSSFNETKNRFYGDLKPRSTSLLLNEANWQLLFAKAKTVEYSAGQIILHQGEQYRRIWQIIDGNVIVEIDDKQGM